MNRFQTLFFNFNVRPYMQERVIALEQELREARRGLLEVAPD
jgi:hypothetical protein